MAEQAQALHHEQIDVVLIRSPLADNTLASRVVREEFVLALPETHPLAQ